MRCLAYARAASVVLVASACNGTQASHPTLVVLIAVDGLRSDILERHDSLFTDGFRRLSDEGMTFSSATVDHAITVSHAGHVTLATGLHPSHHGIVDAAFYSGIGQGTPTLTDAVLDSMESIVGIDDAPGVSPRRVLQPGIAEWIRASDPAARVAGVGSGEHSSLLHVLHPEAIVYWFMRSHGRYVTSSYYGEEDPTWVDRFNNAALPRVLERSLNWEALDLGDVDLGRPDDYPFEADGIHTAFPHRFTEEILLADQTMRRRWRWLSNTPYLDEATLMLAREAITAMQLGQRKSTDYLAIVLSQVDNISHWHGPSSHEVLDTMLRLDLWLGEFFRFLDTVIPGSDYVLALSSDHGMPNLIEYEIDQGKSGYRVRETTIDSLQARVTEIEGVDADGVIDSLLRAQSYIADVYRFGTTDRSFGSYSFARLYWNSYRHDRIPRLPLFSFADGTSAIAARGFMLRLIEGAAPDLGPVTHGSPYSYDRRVPLVFMGGAVRPGTSDGKAHTVDVAPTLASLGGVGFPDDLDGSVLIR